MDYFNDFIKSSPEKTLKDYRTQPDSYWKSIGEKMAIKLFKEMSERVPAYKDFLKKNKINPSKILTIKEFKKVPVMAKDSYINKYKLSDLCWDGKLETNYLLSASSGSTGVPNFWPRSAEQTMHGASISELIYKEYFEMDKKSTLYIVAFAMGTWIAGTYMMMSTEWVAQKGYPITIVTPGLNKDEILRLIKMGGENYEQTILVGYPPFVKDVIDSGIEQGINFRKMDIKFMFSGEAVTERWRDHLQAKTGFKNILKDTVDIYGSADVGLVAHETVLTTFLRRQAMENKAILQELFHAERVPSVNQYDPRLRYFEKLGDELHVTTRSGIPLVRYNTKDLGDILYAGEAEEKLRKHGIDLEKSLSGQKVGNLLWRTPIVYLFGRGKFTATIYGVNIFPEYMKLILDHSEIEPKVTGKFVNTTQETKTYGQTLSLHIELKENVNKTPQLEKIIKELFLKELPKLSSEYKHLLDSMKSKVHPKVILCDYGDHQYFSWGVTKKTA